MNNFLYFGSGYFIGYLTHKYRQQLIFNAFKQYAYTHEYYDWIVKSITSYSVPVNCNLKFIALNILNNKIDNNKICDIGILLNEYQKTVLPLLNRVNVDINLGKYEDSENNILYYFPLSCYHYETKKIYTLGSSFENIISTSGLEDIILTANLILKNEDNTYEYDITEIINSTLLCDGYFLFSGDIKKIWWYTLCKDKIQLVDGANISIEYMSRNDLMIETLDDGIITVDRDTGNIVVTSN